MASLHVELVAADRSVWSGEASLVTVRTTEGEIGLMPGHEPLLAVLTDGPVSIHPTGEQSGGRVVAAVHGGFVSLDSDLVSVLAETAELAEEIDVERAREALSRAEQADHDDLAALAARKRAELRIAVAGIHR